MAKRGEFHIYRTYDFTARELHTDKEVQALAMNAMRKRQRDNLFSSIFFGLFYPGLIFKGKIMLSIVHVEIIPMVLIMVACLWMSINSIVSAVKLIKLKKRESIC